MKKCLINAVQSNYYEKRLEGIFRRCACHETDHLDGKLFIDLVDEFVEPEEEA